jgi:hypothetical protein
MAYIEVPRIPQSRVEERATFLNTEWDLYGFHAESASKYLSQKSASDRKSIPVYLMVELGGAVAFGLDQVSMIGVTSA